MQLLGTNISQLPCHKPVYLIHGGEALQTLEATKVIREQLKKDGFIERQTLEVTNNFNWEQLIEASQTLSLFSSKQLIELHLKEDKIGLLGSKAIMQYLGHPCEDLCLLIIANKLEVSTQKTKWFAAIEQAGCTIVAKPIIAEQFRPWVVARLKHYNFIAPAELIALLTRLYFGNLVAIAQLIETLAICEPPGELTLDQVSPHLHNNAEFNIFNLVDAAIEEDGNKVCQIFKRLKTNKAEPAIILWGVARELRTLIKISFALDAGQPYTEICREHGVWASRASKMRKYLNNTSNKQLAVLLQSLTKVDLIIKGVQPGLVWESLLTMYLQFANVGHI